LAVAAGSIYVGDANGVIWQQSPDATQWAAFANTSYGAIEALTYVPARNALYLVSGGRLSRVPLDTRVEELLLTSWFSAFIPNFTDVTGLAWDAHDGGLYGIDRTQSVLFRFDDVDLADTSYVMTVGFTHLDFQDLAFDGTEHPGRMIAVDAATQMLVEIDHLGLTWQDGATLSVVVRSLAMEHPNVLIAVENTWGSLVRFEPNGTPIP
jgi:hypothetical protein